MRWERGTDKTFKRALARSCRDEEFPAECPAARLPGEREGGRHGLQWLPRFARERAARDPLNEARVEVGLGPG